MVGSPAISSAQWTLDGWILSEEELDAVESEVHGKAPCTKQCWEAMEERCVCRCGGRNHGAAYRNLTSLDEFGGVEDERLPVVGHDIMRAEMELLWRARREIVAAYGSLLGGLIRLPKAVMEELDVDEGDELLFFSNGGK